MAESDYQPPPDYSQTLTPSQAAPRFAGLYQATMNDGQPVAPRQPAQEPAQRVEQPRQAREPAEPDTYQPPPRIDGSGEEERVSAPAEAGADDGQEAEEETGTEDQSRSLKLPPGLSKTEQERFLSLPPEAQAFIAEREQTRNNAKAQEGREAAEARRAREAIEQERAQYAQALKPLIQKLDETYANKWAKVNFAEIAKTDPVAAQQQFFEYQAFLADSRAAHAEAQRLDALQKQDAEKRLQEHLAAENDKLQRLVPDYADGRKQKKLMGDWKQTCLDYGFTEEEFGGVADARMFQLVNDAMQWRRAQKARTEAEKSPPPRTIRSGNGAATPQVQRAAAAQQQLARTGRPEDAAAFFKARKLLQ
jgi:hypothetical protein